MGGGLNQGSRLIKGSGHLIRIPAIDVAEVGAGGGSLAWIDPGGVLRVGPGERGRGAGARVLRRGGERPTVTDANLVLGYLNPGYLVGGELRLDAARAERALREHVAEPLGLSLLDAAEGIHRIANAAMQRAIRSVSIERGRDPRDFTLVAFGGSGPVHAAGLAEALDIGRILIPPHPGLFSAIGLLERRRRAALHALAPARARQGRPRRSRDDPARDGSARGARSRHRGIRCPTT